MRYPPSTQTFNRGLRHVYLMKTVSTKVPKQLEEQIDAYAEEIEETRSVAMRKLLREGLDAENQEGTNPIE